MALVTVIGMLHGASASASDDAVESLSATPVETSSADNSLARQDKPALASAPEAARDVRSSPHEAKPLQVVAKGDSGGLDASGGANLGAGIDGLPGVIRTGSADAFVPGPGLSVSSSYGYTGAALERNDSQYRAATRIAATYAFSSDLAMGLRLDGRYDKHFLAAGNDDGWGTDPRLFLRYRQNIAPNIDAGVQLGLWSPGGFSALSFELVAAMTWSDPSRPLKVSANFGYRLDRSAAAAPNAELLSDADRVSIGLSEFNAVLAAVGVSYTLGSVDLLGELSIDLLHGTNAPDLDASPSRLALGARYLLPNDWFFFGNVEYVLGEPLASNPQKSLIVVDPRITVLAGLQVPFGAHRSVAPVAPAATSVKIPEPPKRPVLGTLRGVVTATDSSAVGAKITLVDVRGQEYSAMTAEDGSFSIGNVTLGAATVRITAEGYMDSSLEVSIVKDGVEIPVELERSIPPGQLMGTVRSLRGGKPLQALIVVMPGTIRIKTDKDGYFEIDLAPGDYVMTTSANGYETQEKSIHIEENGVTLPNPELRRARGGKGR